MRLIPGLWLLGAPTLLFLAVLKVATVPLAFLYLAGDLPQSDLAAAGYVALQWLLSGLITTGAMTLAPRLVSEPLARPAATLMSLYFLAACLGGVLLAIPLKSLVA